MLPQIDYDRSAREYRVIDPETGEITETFPAGHKTEAFRYAVALFDPDLVAAAGRIVEKHPQLERVTWKAVELVANEQVEVYDVPRGDVMAMVASSDQYGRYAVRNDAGYLVCECPHFQEFGAPVTESGSRYCKHILAMHLWRVTKENRF